MAEESDFSNTRHLTISKTQNLYTDIQDSHYKSSYESKTLPLRRESKFNSTSKLDEGPARLATSLRDESKSFKMGPAKEFGSYSNLLAPALLSGKKNDSFESNNRTFTEATIDERASKGFRNGDAFNSSSKYAASLTQPAKSHYGGKRQVVKPVRFFLLIISNVFQKKQISL